MFLLYSINCLKGIFDNLFVFSKLNKTNQETNSNKSKTQHILNINNKNNNRNHNISNKNFLTTSFTSDNIFEDYYYMNKKQKDSVSHINLIKMVFNNFIKFKIKNQSYA